MPRKNINPKARKEREKAKERDEEDKKPRPRVATIVGGSSSGIALAALLALGSGAKPPSS